MTRFVVAEIDRFFLENDLPSIVSRGELINFTVPKNEFNSLRSLDEYLIKFNSMSKEVPRHILYKKNKSELACG